MATANDLLNLVRAQLGNGGKKYWDWYFGGGYINGSVTPYCACGVSWSLATMQVKCPYFPSAVAFDSRDKAIIGSRWVDKYQLQAGDVMAFDWEGDGKGNHVGFCEHIISPKTIQTLEFNTSGGIVARRSRDISTVIGGIRPYYSKAKLDVDGYIGRKTISEWQEQVNATHQNKWVGGQREAEERYHSALTAVSYDGGGSRLVATVQRKLGLTPTGYWDYDFSGAVQSWLNHRGYKLTADHYFGHKSAKALQQSLNDGVWR